MPQPHKSGRAFPREAQRNDKVFLGAGVVRGSSVTERPMCTKQAAAGSPPPGCLQPKTVYLQTDTFHSDKLTTPPHAVHNRHRAVPSSRGSRCHFRVYTYNLTPAFLYTSVISSVSRFHSQFHSLALAWVCKLRIGSRTTANSYKTSSEFHMSDLPPE